MRLRRLIDKAEKDFDPAAACAHNITILQPAAKAKAKAKKRTVRCGHHYGGQCTVKRAD